MAKFKGAKWAQILTLMAAMAASIVSEVASAKSYADGLVKKNKTPHIVGSSLVFPADAEAKIDGSTLVLSK
jgi:ABC-type phosphate transport system substrate-binding protein